MISLEHVFNHIMVPVLHSTVGSKSDCKSRSHKFESQVNHITIMEIGNEVISKIILPLQLIQERQLSVTGRSMCLSTGQPLRGLSLPSRRVSRLNDLLHMTLTVLTGL